MEYTVWIIIWIIIAVLVIFIIYYIKRKPKNLSSKRDIPPQRNYSSPINFLKPNIKKDDKLRKASSLSRDNEGGKASSLSRDNEGGKASSLSRDNEGQEDERNVKLGKIKQSYYQDKIKDIQDKLRD